MKTEEANTLTVERSMEKLRTHQQKLINGEGKLAPGQPYAFSPAATVNDRIWQGDLKLTIRESLPPEKAGYKLREDGNGQLVPGNTTGAKHIVRDVAGCEIYNPPGWSPTYDELGGPFLVTKTETVVDHPTHGPVTIPAGMIVEAGYQRVWDQELAKERRQRD